MAGALMVGVDGSPSSTSAVERAARDADMRNVPIKLVHPVAPIVAGAQPVSGRHPGCWNRQRTLS